MIMRLKEAEKSEFKRGDILKSTITPELNHVFINNFQKGIRFLIFGTFFESCL